MSQKFYCKHCGLSFCSVFALANARCPRRSGNEKHILYEGVEKIKYTCKFWGLQFPAIFAMVNARCLKNPSKGGHKPTL